MSSDNIPEVPVAFLPQRSHGLRGRLGFCPAPGRWRFEQSADPEQMVDDDLASLCACGAKVLVVLLEEDEMARIGLPDLRDRATRAGLDVLWFPIPDGTAPVDVNATARLVTAIVERLVAGRTVIVHCHGGVGRSGTIAALCLVASGTDPESALELVREARPGAATAPGQEEFVRAFAARERPWIVERS